MDKNEIFERLKVFDKFKFFPEDHHYECNGKRVGISVTRFIEEFCNEFDAETVAQKVADKNDVTVQQVLDEWKYKNELACEKGHFGHEFAQNLWNGINYQENIKHGLEAVKMPLELIKQQAKNFYDDFYDKFEHLADELVVGDEDYDICSAIDHVFFNKLTGGLVLVDYKTNSDIHKTEKYAKKMKVPLIHLKDFTLNHYYIQLSIYKYLFEKHTGLVFEDMFIVYMSENIDNYQIIEAPYLKDEVIKILESRRCKNMNSVPVLLIGKSGSGKSASLRNFKKEEIAIANVLGKPLPFKSDLEAPKVDDYNIILKAIENTDKKVIVIDDAGYLITNEFMAKSSVKGYDKYNDMANNFWNLINGIKNIKGGKTVYLVMHEDEDELGNIKPKTIGKLLDDKCNIQGIFTICIRSMFENGKYIFRLKTNGQDCVKTPIGLFEEEEMENDLKIVDGKIREYYELDKENE